MMMYLPKIFIFGTLDFIVYKYYYILLHITKLLEEMFMYLFFIQNINI